MRAVFLSLILAIGLLTCAVNAVAATPDGSAVAVWTRHRVHLQFGYGPAVISESGPWQQQSCDRLYDEVKLALLQLGARVSDLDFDQRGCYGSRAVRGDDVTFSVLTPVRNVAVDSEPAHWQSAELKGNCAFLEYMAKKVLPLTSARDVQRISKSDCDNHGIGLRARILMPTQQVASAP